MKLIGDGIDLSLSSSRPRPAACSHPRRRTRLTDRKLTCAWTLDRTARLPSARLARVRLPQVSRPYHVCNPPRARADFPSPFAHPTTTNSPSTTSPTRSTHALARPPDARAVPAAAHLRPPSSRQDVESQEGRGRRQDLHPGGHRASLLARRAEVPEPVPLTAPCACSVFVGARQGQGIPCVARTREYFAPRRSSEPGPRRTHAEEPLVGPSPPFEVPPRVARDRISAHAVASARECVRLKGRRVHSTICAPRRACWGPIRRALDPAHLRSTRRLTRLPSCALRPRVCATGDRQ